MLDNFNKLKERASELGNHHRKYLFRISSHKDELIRRLEQSGRIDEVHFWTAAPDLDSEMETVATMGQSVEEKTAFLGSYCALQLLHLNIRAVDILRLGLSAQEHRFRLYRDFMMQMGADLRRLIGCYMVKLLDLFLPAE